MSDDIGAMVMSEEQGEGYYWWWPSGREEKPKTETEEDAAISAVVYAFVVVLFIVFSILVNWDVIIVVGLEVFAAILFLAGIVRSKENSKVNASIFLVLLALPIVLFALMQYWKIVIGLSVQAILPAIVLLKGYQRFYKPKKTEKPLEYISEVPPFLYNEDLLRGPEDIHWGPPSKKEVKKKEHANS